MSDMYAHLNVKILEKEYQIACPASERAALLDSAELLNKRMREIRDSGKVVGLDRIAVMAALNMANDMLQAQSRGKALESLLGDRIRQLSSRVDSALTTTKQLDL